jgi:uncharacterized repeat protein (TIGR02543 family)
VLANLSSNPNGGYTLTISGTGAMNDGYSRPWQGHQITAVVVEEGVTSVGSYAFSNVYYITSVTLPSSLTSIGESAFGYCRELTSITIPDGVTTIGDDAFDECYSLTEINLGSSVQTLNASMIDGCQSLAAINVSADNQNFASVNGVVYTKDMATLLKAPVKVSGAYSIPQGVTAIAGEAFARCYDLTSVTFPNSLTTIGEAAFLSCGSLSTVAIGSGLTSLAMGAFAGANVTAFTVDAGNPSYAAQDGVIYSKDMKTLVQYPGGKYANTYTIPAGTTGVAAGAFAYCSNVRTVNFPSGLTTIGDYAFTLCSSLQTVNLNKEITTVGEGVFSNCDKLTAINVADGNASYASVDGVLFSADKATLMQYPAAKPGEYAVPVGTVTIADNAFGDCDNLAGITFPEGLTTIGDDVFYSWNFSAITLPSTITSVGDYAFGSNQSPHPAEKVTILNPTPPTLGENPFGSFDSWNARYIYVPAGAVEAYKEAWGEEYADYILAIGTLPTWDCSALGDSSVTASLSNDTLYINGTGKMKDYGSGNTPWQSQSNKLTTVVVGSGVTSIGSYAFSSFSKITSVNFPEGIESIGNYAFYYCEKLTSVAFPEGMKTIGSYAFNGCDNLISVTFAEGLERIESMAFYNCPVIAAEMTLPASLTYMGSRAFGYDSPFTEVVSLNTTPPTVSSYDFFLGEPQDVQNFKILVPEGSVESYKSVWSEYAQYIEAIVYRTVSFELNGGTGSTAPLSIISGHLAAAPATPVRSGFNFVGWYKEATLENLFNFATDRVTEDLNLFAKWIDENAVIYTVTFDAQNGEEPMQVQVEGGTTINGTTPEREGHTFEGWYTQPNGGGNPWNFGAPVAASVTLYAKWTPLTFTVTFVSNGVTLAVYPDVPYGTTVEEPAEPAEREGYTFSGWAIMKNGYVDAWWHFERDVITKDLVIEASWNAKSYTVTFDAQNGEENTVWGEQRYGETVSEPSEPYRSGYTFVGWYKEAECINPWNFDTDVVKGELTLYARWIDESKYIYTVTLDLQDCVSAPIEVKVGSGDTLTAPAFAREGFTFDGWYMEPACQTPWNISDEVWQSYYLYAKWTVSGGNNADLLAIIEALKVDTARLNSELAQCQSATGGDNSELLTTIAALKADTLRLSNRVTELNANVAELTADNAELSEDNQELEDENQTLTAANDELEDEKQTLIAANDELEDEKQQLQLDNDKLVLDTLRLFDLYTLCAAGDEEGYLDMINSLTDQVNVLKVDTTRLNNSIEELQGDIEELNAEIAELTEENEELDSENQTLTAANTALQNDKEALIADTVRLYDLLTLCESGSSAVKETVKAIDVTLYPNPVVNGELTIDNEQWKSGEPVEIYNMSGALVSTHLTTGRQTTLNISALPVATYVIKVGHYIGKFVKR